MHRRVPPTEGREALPYTEILFLPAHNYTQERWTGPKLGAENPQAPQLTGVDHVEVLDRLRDELVRILPAPAATIYVNSGDLSASSMAWLTRTNAFPNYISTQDADPLIAELRVRKDAGEIELIRKATQASMAAHLAAMKAMKPGTGERQIAALMQYEFSKRGCERPAYAPIVGAGYNSTVLHYSDNDGPIRDGDVVVMDVAGEYSMYASDITRTLPANGKFTPRQREIYEIVLGAQQAAMDAFQSGKSTSVAQRTELSLQSRLRLHQLPRKGSERPATRPVLHSWPEPLCWTWKFMTPATTHSPWVREWYSPSSPASTFPRKRSASASKTSFTSTTAES